MAEIKTFLPRKHLRELKLLEATLLAKRLLDSGYSLADASKSAGAKYHLDPYLVALRIGWMEGSAWGAKLTSEKKISTTPL